MTTTTLRKCDGCGTVVYDTGAFWTIGVVAVLNANPKVPFPQQFNRNQIGTGNNIKLKNHWMDLCSPCMEKRGMSPEQPDEPAKEPPTLDDLLREIVREEVDDAFDEGGR